MAPAMKSMKQTIYLASRSPRRRELLKQIGVAFQLFQLREEPGRDPDVDETPARDESASAYALRIARTKAEVASHYMQRRALSQRWPVLAADTTVVCAGRIIGKPATNDEAARMLKELAGTQHEVVTAIALAFNDRVETAVSESKVWFRDLAQDEIRRYVAAGESLDKAGGYAVQGRAAAFITRIEGSYSGIVGLPLAETASLLAKAGIETL
ncbi:MAG TPA: Maf family protein [Burkholderiales bacterium]|nr:Maf family protein [Burkholderiales bacterium]